MATPAKRDEWTVFHHVEGDLRSRLFKELRLDRVKWDFDLDLNTDGSFELRARRRDMVDKPWRGITHIKFTETCDEVYLRVPSEYKLKPGERIL